MCTARGARTDVHRKRALRGARAEAAHDGPVTNPFSNRTIVCGLAGGGLGGVLSVHLARPPAPRFGDRGHANKYLLGSPYVGS